MKLVTGLLVTLTLTAGLAGGVRAYSVAATAGPPPVPLPVAAPRPPAPQVVRPGVVVRWAPCRAPAVRVGRACVTRIVHVVRLAPAVTTPVPVATARAPQAAPTRPPGDHPAEQHESGEHHDDGEPGDGGEDGGGGGGDD